MSYNPAQAVANAKSDVGYHEGPNNANKFSLWQYGNSRNPWCDSAVCKWSWDAGFRFPPYSACGDRGDYNVGAHHQHAVRQGIWRSRSARARPGWLVVLTFGIPDQHIEMVLADQGGNIATIGGNTSDRVAYRIRYRANIVGFIALDEAGQNLPTPVPKPPVHKSEDDVIAIAVHNSARKGNEQPFGELDTANRKILSWWGFKIDWDGGGTGTLQGKTDPHSMNIPGEAAATSWEVTDGTNAQDTRRRICVYGVAGNQWRGTAHG